MKEIIVIQGASLAEIRPVVAEVAMRLAERAKDEEWTIFDLYLSATSKADTFVLKPNKMCHILDFNDICLALKEGFAPNKEVHLQAWMQLNNDTMWGIPAGQSLYIGFDNPDRDELDYTDRQGNNYHINQEDDEAQSDESEKGTYHPYPTLQHKNLPEGEGHFTIGERNQWTKAHRLRNFFKRMRNLDIRILTPIYTLMGTLIGFIPWIFLGTGAWSFSETLLPWSMPHQLPVIFVVVFSLLIAVTKVFGKVLNFWLRLTFGFLISLPTFGLILTMVFSVNKWFHDDTPIYGSGVIDRHVVTIDHFNVPGIQYKRVEFKPAEKATQKEMNDDHNAHHYRILVSEPKEGIIYISLGHDKYHNPGEPVRITFYKGLWGMLYAVEVK